MPDNKLEIIMAGAEMSPFVKVGGLGDVAGSLPLALAKLGIKVKFFLPLYGAIDRNKFRIKQFKKGFSVIVHGQEYFFDIYQTKLATGVNVFFIKNDVFDLADIYIGGRKYLDKNKQGTYTRKLGDIERFIFFSKAVVETIKRLKWQPDLVHVHDWHTAMLPAFIDEYSLKHDNFKNIKSLYTIHNLANQGVAGLDILDYAGLDKEINPALMEDYYDQDGGKINIMKLGILSADYINTVSPSYAQEILTKEYGAHLDGYLNRRKKNLVGILNGLDLKLFDPAKDKNISQNYSVKDFLKGKQSNKEVLQKISQLPVKDVPIFGLVSRLVAQKGLDILLESLEEKIDRFDFQIIILGTGQKYFEDRFRSLAQKYPEKLVVNVGFSLPLAQKIYAGADFFLMPSRFEPCGLGQMIAMRYGAIPVVRATGGLKDTVVDNKTGLVFRAYSKKDLGQVLDRSLALYKNKNKFVKILKTGMEQDFSWDKSAKEYLNLYNKLK